MTPRETFGLCCFHITKIMTDRSLQTLPLTLQLCYKTPSTKQRVTKSQKVYQVMIDCLIKMMFSVLVQCSKTSTS